MASEIVNTIMEQIDWRELRMAKFKFSTPTSNELILYKNTKAMSITYDIGSDTYTIITSKRGLPTKPRTNVYWEALKPAIQSFFKFEYVMRGLKIHFNR